MNQIWLEKPVKVYTDSEAASKFLSQTELPYLWLDIEEYVNEVNKSDNPQRDLRIGWTAAYLTHTNPLIVANTLQDHVTTGLLNSWLIGGLLPELLVHSDEKVQEEAAKALWRNAMNLYSIFGVLTGEYPGITKTAKDYLHLGKFKQKAGSIVKNLRKYCPPEKKDKFEELVLENFGPSLSEKKESKSSGKVTFKELTKKDRMGITMTYEVYTAPSKLDALSFLENKKVDVQFLYVIVETPEGNWGKDTSGIFEE